MTVLLIFAFLSGIVTVLSPCVLPVLPIVLSSSAASGKRRPLGVITGLIISFSIFTLLITQIVALLGLSANTLRIVAVVIIGFLGLSMIIPKLNEIVEKALSFIPRLAGNNQHEGNGFMPGFITGLSLGLVWAPCAGPILASVTALAATQSVNFGSALVVIAYAIGSGIPLLAIAYGGRSLIQKVPFLNKNLGKVQRGFGVVMMLTAVAIAMNMDVLVTAWLTEKLPSGLSSALSAFETSETVTKQLDVLANREGGVDYFVSGEITKENLLTGVILPNLGPAPELVGVMNWINTELLVLEELRGKVVLIDFWTYSCINCVRTLPYLNDWHAKYADDGLVIIGVHTPEFEFEKELGNVQEAVERFNIEYAVVQDNEFKTWRAFNNRYWPAKYVVDAEGNIRYTHFGEGKYDESELVIRQLLSEIGVDADEQFSELTAKPYSSEQTKETYVGYGRQAGFVSPEPLLFDAPGSYSIPAEIELHRFAVAGRWNFMNEFAEPLQAGAQLKLHFYGKNVFLVMDSKQSAKIRVELLSPDTENMSPDLEALNEITIDEARLYHLVSMDKAQEGTLLIEFLDPEIQVFAFTFGS